MNTLRNFTFSLCFGSIVAIITNLQIGTAVKFSSTAFALGIFVFSALFVLKPIRAKQEFK